MKTNFILTITLLSILTLSSCSRTQETTPERHNIVDAVFASGNVIMEKNYLITAQSESTLAASYVTEGDSVKAGQLLFQLQNAAQQAMEQSSEAGYHYAKNNTLENSPVWQKLKQQQIQLKNQLTNDSIQYLRYKNLYAVNAVSKAEYDRAELAYKNSLSQTKEFQSTMADTKKTLQLDALNAKAGYLAQQNTNQQYLLKSEYQGLVLSAPKINGELVKKGETIAQIGSGKFLAKLLISESDINKIRTGQIVYIELNTDKRESQQAYISKIYPAFDETEQSFIAEATFTGSNLHLHAGTQLQANIVVNESKNALVIPTAFLQPDNSVILAKNKEKKQVKTGIVTAEWTEIKSGLNDNDHIIMLNK